MLLFIGAAFSLPFLADGIGPFKTKFSERLELAYPNGIQAKALVQNALHLLIPSIPVEYRDLYPAPDPALLQAAKDAQAEKRKVRVRLNVQKTLLQISRLYIAIF